MQEFRLETIGPSGDCAVDLEDVVEFILAGRGNAGAFIDFAGIEQVQDGEALDVQYLVHALDAQATFPVQEVGNVRLLETCLPGQAQAGQLAFFDALAKSFPQILLQRPELHAQSIAFMYSVLLFKK